MAVVVILIALALVLGGCSRAVDATPVPEPPPKLDCDLIFPGPDGR